jgi:hypothetical protein
MISLTTISPRPHASRRQARTVLSMLALLCACASMQAHAQFMDMLKNAVGNAAANAAASAASKATTTAINGAMDGAKSSVAPDKKPAAPNGTRQAAQAAGASAAAAAVGTLEDCPASEGPALAPLGPRPAAYQPEALWPDPPTCIAHEFAHYKFQSALAQVLAFDKAGSPPCPECGGSGRAHDYQARLLITKDGRFTRDFDEPILKLRSGERMEWQGKRYSGTIVLVGEQPIGDFPCRQYKWTLLNKDKEVVAERPGLYCKFIFRDQEVKWRQVV